MTEPAAQIADRLLGASIGAMDVLSIAIGDRLGYYRCLATHGAMTSAELARATGTTERYVREWLEQQAVSGFLDATDDPAGRRFGFAPGAAEALADPDSLLYVAPLARQVAALARQVPAVSEAFRSGQGVPWEAYGPDMRESESDLNRPGYLRLLTQQWLPAAVPDVCERLLSGSATRLADVGCGAGWSTIALALGFPDAQVHGYDVDAASVELAQANIAHAGLADRVEVRLADIGSVQGEPSYDLLTAFECLHDLPHPVEALAAMRRLTAGTGTVLVADMNVAGRFVSPGDDVERLMYGYSVLVCLPDSMSTAGSAATGTVMRESTLRAYAEQAGFSRVEVPPVDHDLWRFYRLTP